MLEEIYIKNKVGEWPDKNSTHSYIPVYEELLAPYRLDPRNKILEIGLFSGHSLLMWEEYFQGDVYGIDCSDQPHGGMMDLRPLIALGTHKISIFDASDPIRVEKYFKGIQFNVIIEDASHDINQQVEIYNNFKSYLAPDGIYIIEDVQDIDNTRSIFEALDPKRTIQILDRRQVKNRYDDVLIVIK